ncbi:hypothetical protein GCM10014713_63270 [Streptomyces purpureus]|uniref:Uncharacterized protein n=1 Tax=Streptomyces purpureus TaxID=1951 RepID=A0A918HHM0_9ACTN|nr:hypothetical protein GCM10014713_63270 [Streptomyces purpureus]
MPAGVDLTGLGDDGLTVVEGDGDGGCGGINGEQEHANSLRLRGPRHAAPPLSAPAATVTTGTNV